MIQPDEHRFWLTCRFADIENQAVFNWFEDANEDERFVYLRQHLPRVVFWRRLWYALRYVFGYQSRYGAFGEIVMNRADAEGLCAFLDEFIVLANDQKSKIIKGEL